MFIIDLLSYHILSGRFFTKSWIYLLSWSTSAGTVFEMFIGDEWANLIVGSCLMFVSCIRMDYYHGPCMNSVRNVFKRFDSNIQYLYTAVTVCFCSLFFHPYFRNSLNLTIGLQAILAMSSTNSTGVFFLKRFWTMFKTFAIEESLHYFFHQRLLTPGIFFSCSLNRMNPY